MPSRGIVKADQGWSRKAGCPSASKKIGIILA
jgi:hypothetical protein